jgi:CBS-domain-containing membrane protein
MKVEDIMTTDVISVNPGSSLVEVAKILHQHKIHSLPVVDNNSNHLVGIVTEMDFFVKDAASSYLPRWLELMNRIRQEGSISLEEQERFDYIIDLRAQDIMTAECVTVSSETDIGQLMDVFKKTRFKSFPVVSDEKILVGIVSLVDVIKSIDF